MKKQLLILLVLMLAISRAAFAQSSGGSNYVMYDIGNYPNNHSTWYDCGVLKPVIGTYNLDPNKVYQQLAAMRQSGQQKITLVLFYAHFSDPGPCGNYVWGHIVSSTGAHLITQHQENLRQIVTHIHDLGFNELVFRFAAQGSSAPENWQDWNEELYQENWNFIYSTRATIEQVLGSSQVKRRYDLGVELGGLEHGQVRPYTKRLWSDYCYAIGKSDTYGFSFAVAPGRLPAMIATYDETGIRPNLYAFDIYDNAYNTLQYLKNELASRGEQAKPVIIQEAWYNDAQSAAEFRLAKQQLGLNILYVMQWQNARNSGIPHFSMNFPEQYFNYVESPRIEAADTGCANCYNIWIRGESFDSNSYVNIRRVDGAGEILTQVSGANLIHDNNSSAPKQLLTLGITDPTMRIILNNPGIRVEVVNPNDGRVSNGVIVRRQAASPKITAAGTGCADNYCIWIRGENFDSNSYVDVRSNDGTNVLLARFSGVSLTRDNSQYPSQLITFAITDPNVRDALSDQGIKVIVVNPDDGKSSNRVTVRRQ